MSTSKLSIGVVLNDVDFAGALGVPRYLLETVRQWPSFADVFLLVRESQIKFLTSFLGSVKVVTDIFEWRRLDLDMDVLPHQFASRKSGRPYVVIVHDFHALDVPLKYPKAEDFISKLTSNFMEASAVIAPFPRVEREYFRMLGVVPQSLHYIPHFDPADLIQNQPRKRNTRKTRFLYPAQFQKHKNHMALLSMHITLRQLGNDVTTVCVGKGFDVETQKHLFDRLRSSKHSTNFFIRGYVSDQELQEELIKCDAVVIPSCAEGGAQVAREATLAGKISLLNRIEAAVMDADARKIFAIWADFNSPQNAVVSALEIIDNKHQKDFLHLETGIQLRESIIRKNERILEQWRETFSKIKERNAV